MRLRVDTKVRRESSKVSGVALLQSVCVSGVINCGKGFSA